MAENLVEEKNWFFEQLKLRGSLFPGPWLSILNTLLGFMINKKVG